MGKGFILTCKNCNYKIECFDGVGMMFEQFYQELVDDIKNGKYGDELKDFFNNNPDAAVNADNRLYQCKQCNEYFNDIVLDAYHGSSCKTVSYPDELKGKIAVKRKHFCPKCKSEMKKVSEQNLFVKFSCNRLKCPCCNKTFSIEDMNKILWD